MILSAERACDPQKYYRYLIETVELSRHHPCMRRGFREKIIYSLVVNQRVYSLSHNFQSRIPFSKSQIFKTYLISNKKVYPALKNMRG
jgi:hypothetical protein